jgi:Sigma-70 region 2
VRSYLGNVSTNGDETLLQGTEERERFEQAFLPLLDAAYNLARWLTGDDHDAEDLVQGAYLALRGVSLCFCFRLPRPALGFWSFPRHWAVIGRHVGGFRRGR